MNLVDTNLATLLNQLSPAERKAAWDHVRLGRRTDLSRAVIRKLRALLKARARSRRK